MGGILYIFTGFQLANFFPGGRSTVCALLIGSYNASALVYPILNALYAKVIYLLPKKLVMINYAGKNFASEFMYNS